MAMLQKQSCADCANLDAPQCLLADCFDGERSEQMLFLEFLVNGHNFAHRMHMQPAGSLKRNGCRFDPTCPAHRNPYKVSGWHPLLLCSAGEGCPESCRVATHHKTFLVPVPAHISGLQKCSDGDGTCQKLADPLHCGTVHCGLGEDCLSLGGGVMQRQ